MTTDTTPSRSARETELNAALITGMTNQRVPAGEPTGGEFTSHLRTESETILEDPDAFIVVLLADGRPHLISQSIAGRFRGVSAEGYNVVVGWENQDGSEYLVGLTPCCNATAKGLELYVGCRKCYQPIDPVLGGEMTVEVGYGK